MSIHLSIDLKWGPSVQALWRRTEEREAKTGGENGMMAVPVETGNVNTMIERGVGAEAESATEVEIEETAITIITAETETMAAAIGTTGLGNTATDMKSRS